MKRGTPDHPKVALLMTALGCERATAVGLLEMLWHYTARYSPRGDIGRWPDENIAAGLSWTGDPAVIVSALTRSRWLDVHPLYRLVVHDWHAHADDATKKYLRRHRLGFLSRVPKVSGQKADMSGQVADLSRLPLPLPTPEPLPLPQPQPPPAAAAEELLNSGRKVAILSREERQRQITEGNRHLDALERLKPGCDRSWELRSHSKGSKGGYLVSLDAAADEHLLRTVHALRDTVERLQANAPGAATRAGLLTPDEYHRQRGE